MCEHCIGSVLDGFCSNLHLCTATNGLGVGPGQVHTNGIESLWSMPKRDYIGTYHKMNPKHTRHYL